MTPSFTNRVLITLGLASLVFVLFFFLAQATKVFLLSFVAVLVAVLLHSVAHWLGRRTPLSHGVALAAVVLFIFALLVGFGWLAGPQLGEQLSGLSQQLPNALEEARQRLSQFGWGQELLERVPAVDAGAEAGVVPEGSDLRGIAGQLLGLLSGVATALGDVFYALLVGIFLASTPKMYASGVVHLVPEPNRDKAKTALSEVYHTLQGWLLGQLVAMVTIGTVVGIGLSLLGVPFALGLGFLAFLFEFIPTIGPWLAGVPAVLMALTVSPTMALWVLGLFIAVELLEGNLLLPLIHERTVDMPPALSLFAIFLFGTLFGLLGVLVAAPLAAVTLTLVKLLYVRDQLGDEVSLPGDG